MGRPRNYPQSDIFTMLDEIYAETRSRPTLDALVKRAPGANKGTLSQDRRAWVAANFPDDPPVPAISKDFHGAVETFRTATQTEVALAEARGRIQSAEKINELTDNIISLEDEVGKVNERRESVEEKNEMLTSENSMLISELASKGNQVKMVERENEGLRRSAETTTLELARALNKAETLTEENKCLREEREAERRTLAELTVELAKTNSAFEAQADRLKEKHDEIASLKSSYLKEAEAKAKTEEEKAVLQERCSNLEKDYEKLTADNQKRREIAERLQNRADKLQDGLIIKVIEAAEAAKAAAAVVTNARKLGEKKVAKASKNEASPRNGEKGQSGLLDIHAETEEETTARLEAPQEEHQ